MRKVLTSLTLACAFVMALSVAASACEYHKQTTASTSQSAGETAQSQPASAEN
jgi:hypothetical protein